jgi:long-chain fatty acid transport protein
MDIFKLGVEWRTSPTLTLRAGYSHNTQPIPSRDAMINILAPGVVQDHITAGAQYRLNQSWDLEFAAMFAPEASVSGTDLFSPGHDIEISMWQYALTFGVKYRFGSDEAPLK